MAHCIFDSIGEQGNHPGETKTPWRWANRGFASCYLMPPETLSLLLTQLLGLKRKLKDGLMFRSTTSV